MQSYKYRKAPWFKCYGKEILDDLLYCSLPIEAKALLIPLWALAAESYSGVFDASPEQLSFRFRGFSATDIDLGIAALISAGFFVDATNEEIDVMVPVSEATATRKAAKEAQKIVDKQAKEDKKSAKKLADAEAKARAKVTKARQDLEDKQLQITPAHISDVHKSIHFNHLGAGGRFTSAPTSDRVSVAADF